MDEQEMEGDGPGWTDKASAGRSLDAQIADVRARANHGVPAVLREMVLAQLGLERPPRRAEHALLFGCYRPFNTPYIVREAAVLLRRLGVGFTWLDTEYCCGLPFLPLAGRERRDEVIALSRGFIQANRDLAAESGARRLVYCCAGCAHAAKGAWPENAGDNVYILDTLLDALGSRPLAVTPRRLAYFEGCHASYRKPYPEVGLDWPRYRAFLERVDGLSLIDLPRGMCCKRVSGKIVDRALAAGAEALVCACSTCNLAMRRAGAGRIPVLSYLDLLSEALSPTVP